MSELKIKISHQEYETQVLDAAFGAYMIGSDASNRIVLQGDDVAEVHAVLTLMEDESYIEDLLGAGVYVMGDRITNRQRVYEGAPVQIGKYTLMFGAAADLELSDGGATGAATPVSIPPREPEAVHEMPDAAVPEVFKPKTQTLNMAAHQKVKQQIHAELVNRLDLKRLSMSKLKEGDLQSKIKGTLGEIIAEIAGKLPPDLDAERLAKDIFDEAVGLGPLEDLLADDSVTEIMVNGPSQVYVERSGKLQLTDRNFIDDTSVNSVIERIVSPIGRRIDESQPYVDARLPDGSRVNAIIHPLSLVGPCLTIRKFSKDPFKVQDLINFGTLTADIAEFLRICVLLRKNMIVSGGTGSGKTTLLNVLSSYLPDDERILTIEDAAELRLTQDHIVRLESRPANIEGRGAVTIRDLVKNALRMRPDRIVVGECRGSEALDMLQAMNTGHEGSLTTIHANTPRDALARLETMVLMAGMELPVKAIREQVGSAVHMICQISRFTDGTRKVSRVTEVSGMEGDRLTLQDLFEFKQTGLDPNGKVLGSLQPTGSVPTFIDEIGVRGLSFDRTMFNSEANNHLNHWR